MTIKTYIEGVIDQLPRGECWLEWPFGKQPKTGRPNVTSFGGGRKGSAVHYAWFLRRGEWPSNWLNHKPECNDARCWNPDHVYEGSPTQNNRDTVATGNCRARQGQVHGMAKLSESEVREIRRQVLAGIKPKELALRFEVDVSTISDIVRGKTWTHLKETGQ